MEWSPPLTPNGVILNYQVSYVGLESVNPVPDSFETVEILNLSGTTYTVDVAGLSPHSLYNISVRAFTSVGGGEESTLTVRTLEEGWFVHKKFQSHIQFPQHTFLNWVKKYECLHFVARCQGLCDYMLAFICRSNSRTVLYL